MGNKIKVQTPCDNLFRNWIRTGSKSLLSLDFLSHDAALLLQLTGSPEQYPPPACLEHSEGQGRPAWTEWPSSGNLYNLNTYKMFLYMVCNTLSEWYYLWITRKNYFNCVSNREIKLSLRLAGAAVKGSISPCALQKQQLRAASLLVPCRSSSWGQHLSLHLAGAAVKGSISPCALQEQWLRAASLELRIKASPAFCQLCHLELLHFLYLIEN